MLVNEFLEKSSERFPAKDPSMQETSLKAIIVPKYIEILGELPKSSHGKVAKKEFR